MLFVPSFSSILPYLLSLLSPPPTALSRAYHFSPYPPSNLSYDLWLEISAPATELLLCLIELKQAQMRKFENGRAIKEIVGLLIADLVKGLESDGEESLDWLEETDVGDLASDAY
jgi:hypothetical protein